MKECSINCATQADFEDGGYLGCTCGAEQQNKKDDNSNPNERIVRQGVSQPVLGCGSCIECYHCDAETNWCNRFGNDILYDMFASVYEVDTDNVKQLNEVGCKSFTSKPEA